MTFRFSRQLIAYLVMFFFLLSMLLLAGRSMLVERWFSALELPSDLVLEVPKGATANTVLKLLSQQSGYQQQWFDKLLFKWFPTITAVKAGQFSIDSGASLYQVMNTVATGKSVLHPIALVEGLTARQWITQLQTHPMIDSRGFDLDAYITEQQWTPNNIEGRLLPDTYHFIKGTPITTVITASHSALERYLTEAWQQRAENLPYHSPYEALIMASIIEKETGVASERPRIAGVFVNRLRKNMRLQTDPTVIYGMGEDYDGNIRRRDLRTPTPYNTYVIKGLPPTPIAMASSAAIDAALHPMTTNELYFVATGDGGHYFSETLAEHNKAVYRYQIKPYKERQ